MTLEKPGSSFLLGLDLGQARDHSAILSGSPCARRIRTWSPASVP